MKLIWTETESYIAIDKPAGFSTHSPDIGKLGLKEILEEYSGQKLYIAHRLDKTTTGNLIFPKSKEFTTQLSNQFADHQVKKTYRFLTASQSESADLLCDSPIDGKKALTRFQRIKRSPFFELWEAFPETGRKHQVRIHAREVGLPILGDIEYQGSAFPHLCLHNSRIEFLNEQEKLVILDSPTPIFFDRLGFLKDPELISWLSEVDRRQRLYQFLQSPQESIRLVHQDQIRMDLFGNQLWIYWYKDSLPQAKDIERVECFSRVLNKKYYLKIMLDRGKSPRAEEHLKSDSWQENWQAQENGIRFHLSNQMGQSPGLFLDQSENRRYVSLIAKNLRILNLFSYTCGFSVAAASGGAAQVVSVDASSRFLEVGKQNFILNQLDPKAHQFYDMDVIKFLKSAVKNKRKFDIVICDPPSFGRTKDSIFRLEDEIDFLLRSCFEVLESGGALLFSTNYEKWNDSQLKDLFQKNGHIFIVQPRLPAWDYELPQQPRLMKYFWLHKKS